jgi:hypothetical protein
MHCLLVCLSPFPCEEWRVKCPIRQCLEVQLQASRLGGDTAVQNSQNRVDQRLSPKNLRGKLPWRYPLPSGTGEMRNVLGPAQAATQGRCAASDTRRKGRLANASTEFLRFWILDFKGSPLNGLGLFVPIGLFSMLSRRLTSSGCLEIDSHLEQSTYIVFFFCLIHQSKRIETCTCAPAS